MNKLIATLTFVLIGFLFLLIARWFFSDAIRAQVSSYQENPRNAGIGAIFVGLGSWLLAILIYTEKI